MPLNPYIAGNPISGDDGFYGREDIFRDVNQVLSHRQQNAIVLYGQRRIGKTSVLLQLERRLADGGRYTPVYFDLMDKAGKPLTAVLWELTQRICLTLHLPLPDRPLFDHEGVYFRDTFLPQAAAQAAAGGLVLLFDEFDVLDSPTQEQAGAAFFPYLRSWMSQAAKVQFVFVIGRRPEDLSTNTMSAFKNVKASRVALLAQKDAEMVIRLAEKNGSLQWPDEAVAAVWNWSQGHPYVIQLLCETIWNQAHEEEEAADEPPIVTPALVEVALDPALVAGANAFVWLWEGLPPAERVILAAIAEADKELITGDDLVEILNRSGVRLIVSQLNVAPQMLVEWGLLQRQDESFKVMVPLLRRWVKQNRPLMRVKDELDRLDPLADRLYKTGEDFYAQGNLTEAKYQLQRALEINPNHLKARLLLGQIFFEEKELDAAVSVLEEAYRYDERAARADLVRALLAQAEKEPKEAEQLALYERILQIDRQQPMALERQQAILAARRKQEIARQLSRADRLEGEERWPEVVTIYQDMLAEVEEPEWQARLAHAEKEAAWQQKYTQALGAQGTGDRATAQQLLAEIIAEKPDYKEAARYLLLATKAVDAASLQTKEREQSAQLTALTQERDALAQQNADLQAKIAKVESWRRLLLVGGFFLLLGLLLGGSGGWLAGLRSAPTATPAPVTVVVTATPSITPSVTPAPPTMTPTSTSTQRAGIAETPAPSETSDPFILPIEATLGMTWTRPTDGMEMVFVPGGRFTMGSDPEVDTDADSDEQPQHGVTLDPFWIDRKEVSNAQFATFLNEMGNQTEGGVTWLDAADTDARIEQVDGAFRPQAGFADHPVTEVSWFGAQAYCAWAGGEAITATLPTEAQWEYAARGPEEFIYPWGNEFDGEKVNFCDVNCSFSHSDTDWDDGFALTAPVGSYPDGDSWVGALDMAGNVWEWTADWYNSDYYENAPDENPTGPAEGTSRVLRGGSWNFTQPFVRAASRDVHVPDDSSNNLGFRCVAPPG